MDLIWLKIVVYQHVYSFTQDWHKGELHVAQKREALKGCQEALVLALTFF